MIQQSKYEMPYDPLWYEAIVDAARDFLRRLQSGVAVAVNNLILIKLKTVEKRFGMAEWLREKSRDRTFYTRSEMSTINTLLDKVDKLYQKKYIAMGGKESGDKAILEMQEIVYGPIVEKMQQEIIKVLYRIGQANKINKELNVDLPEKHIRHLCIDIQLLQEKIDDLKLLIRKNPELKELMLWWDTVSVDLRSDIVLDVEEKIGAAQSYYFVMKDRMDKKRALKEYRGKILDILQRAQAKVQLELSLTQHQTRSEKAHKTKMHNAQIALKRHNINLSLYQIQAEWEEAVRRKSDDLAGKPLSDDPIKRRQFYSAITRDWKRRIGLPEDEPLMLKKKIKESFNINIIDIHEALLWDKIKQLPSKIMSWFKINDFDDDIFIQQVLLFFLYGPWLKLIPEQKYKTIVDSINSIGDFQGKIRRMFIYKEIIDDLDSHTSTDHKINQFMQDPNQVDRFIKDFNNILDSKTNHWRSDYEHIAKKEFVPIYFPDDERSQEIYESIPWSKLGDTIKGYSKDVVKKTIARLKQWKQSRDEEKKRFAQEELAKLEQIPDYDREEWLPARWFQKIEDTLEVILGDVEQRKPGFFNDMVASRTVFEGREMIEAFWTASRSEHYTEDEYTTVVKWFRDRFANADVPKLKINAMMQKKILLDYLSTLVKEHFYEKGDFHKIKEIVKAYDLEWSELHGRAVAVAGKEKVDQKIFQLQDEFYRPRLLELINAITQALIDKGEDVLVRAGLFERRRNASRKFS